MNTIENPWVGAYVLGIDLGTTKSVMSLWNPKSQRAEALPNAEGEYRTPSVVAWDRTAQEWRVGTPALAIGKQFPQDMVYSVKRLMGRWYEDEVVQRWKDKFSYPIEPDDYNPNSKKSNIAIVVGQDALGKRLRLKPEQLSALILRKLRLDAQAELIRRGVDPAEALISYAVVTVPAYFNQFQRGATKTAAGLAGLDATILTSGSPTSQIGFTETRLLEEPTAAALTYRYKINEQDQRFLIYDLGGGTFDINLLRCQRDTFGYQIEVEFPDGDTDLGGDHIDQELISRATTHLTQTYPEMAPHLGTMAVRERLRQALETAKRALNETTHTTTVTFSASELGATGTTQYHFNLTDEIVEASAKPTVDATLRILTERLAFEELQYDQIEYIVLVGGPTQMPYLRRRLVEATGKTLGVDLLADGEPQLVVGKGAGEAAMIYADPAGLEIKTPTNLIPVLPQTLSILGGEDFKQRKTLIPARTPLTSAEGKTTVYTREKGQTWIRIPITQATHAQERENQYTIINEITMEFMEAPAEPIPLEVTFIVKEDGRFTVTVKDAREGGQMVTKDIEGGRTSIRTRASADLNKDPSKAVD